MAYSIIGAKWRSILLQGVNALGNLVDIKSTDDGMLHVSQAVEVSTLNSTTTPLSAGATYTGTGELNYHPQVFLNVQTDQDGVCDIQYSQDGTNWGSYPVSGFLVRAGINKVHVSVKAARYIRVVFENTSASDQTYLRITTQYGYFGDLVAPSNQSIGVDGDAKAVRPTDYRYEVARGLRGGSTTWNKWGYNNSIGGTEETVWSVGGRLSRLTSAETLDISSSSADDTDGDIGANSIIIYGVDGDFNAVTEVVTMNGTSAVTTVNSYLGVNRMSNYETGSTASNVGIISAVASTAATTQAEIPAGEGSTQHAFFFVSNNHLALMDWLTINNVKLSGGGNPIITTKAYVTSLVSGSVYDIFNDYMNTSTTDFREYKPSQPFVIGEKSLIEFTSKYSSSSGAANIRFSLIEVQIL